MPEFSLMQALSLEVAAGLMAIVFSKWTMWQRIAARGEEFAVCVSRRPSLCFFLVFCAAIAIRLALLPVKSVPIPLFHDEFSYLLGADTFAHGRLTNPQLPVAGAFETIHILMWPTYQSMYLPGTALLLLVGQLLGFPWISVLLGTAGFCAAVYWMVSGWLSRPYALAAALIAVGVTENLNWWLDNYFCVALCSLGMALVIGSLPRIVQRRRWQETALLGAGLTILIFTRPYEGFCIAFPCVLVLVWTMRGAGPARLAALAATPFAMLTIGFAWLLYYNWRGTGHPLLFPYMLDFRTYHITGPFIFSREQAIPHYRLDILRRFYIFAEVTQYDFMHAHPWEFLARKLWIYYYTFLFGFALLLVPGIVHLARTLREKLHLAPLLALAGFGINVVLMGWAPFPQYAAPAAPLLLLVVAFGLLAIANLRSPWIDGRRVLRGLVLSELMLGFSIFGLRVANSGDLPEPRYVSYDRAMVAAKVLSQPGKQLCLVRYAPVHESWQEWVFDGADPQQQQLVWARSLDPETDREVIAAYPGRTVWLVQPDRPESLITLYPRSREHLPPSFAGPDYRKQTLQAVRASEDSRGR